MSFFGQDPVQSFLWNKTPVPNPVPTPQPEEDKTVVDSVAAKAVPVLQWVWSIWSNFTEWLDLAWGFITWDWEQKNATKKWEEEDKKAKEKLEADRAREEKIQQTFSNSLSGFLQTTSPKKQKIVTNDILTMSSKINEMHSVIDSTPWDFSMINDEDKMKSIQAQRDYIDNTITPALIEIMKKKNSYLDDKGSVSAYNKAMEDERIKELTALVSDYSNNLTENANTQALNQYWSDWRYVMWTYQWAVKIADKMTKWYDFLAVKLGLGNPNVVSDIKYTKWWAPTDAWAIEKNLYAVKWVGSDIIDWTPEIVTNLLALKGWTGVEKWADDLNSAIWASNKFNNAGLKVYQYNKANPTALAVWKNMLSDTVVYDISAQTFMGRPMTEDDVKMNVMMNLPINFWIGLLARSPLAGRALANEFDISKTFDADWTVNITAEELKWIKEWRSDKAELLMLSRSRVWSTDKIPELINIRNLSTAEDGWALAKKVARAANNVTNTIESAKAWTESAKQTLQLTTAQSKNLYMQKPKTQERILKEYDSTANTIDTLSSTVQWGVTWDNANKFWNKKLMDQAAAWNINLEESLAKVLKTNPELSDAARLFEHVNNLVSDTKWLTKEGLTDMWVKRIKSDMTTLLKKMYNNDIIDAWKLMDGERLSPVHVFSNWTIKNIETGKTMPVSDFMKQANPLAYEKKALKETVIDDLAGNLEVFQFFNKKLKWETKTDGLITLLNKSNFNNLTEKEVTLLRASLAAEIIQDLQKKGKEVSMRTISAHPAYRIFSKNEDGTYRIALDNIDTTDLVANLGKMFKEMDEMSIIKYLWDLKAQDEIITWLKKDWVKNTVASVTANHPDYLKKIWTGFSEMLMRKSTAKLNSNLQLPKITKADATRMMMQLQKAFPNIPIVFGKLPDWVKGIVSPFEGKLIIDESKMTEFTSVHEFGHVWIMHAKWAETELYNTMSKAVQDSPYYAKVKKEYWAIYKTESEFIDEAIAHAIEDSGARFLNKVERQTFMEKVIALIQSIFLNIQKSDITWMTDDVVNRLFNTNGKSISDKTLAELDVLQFTKEDFDKNSYFIRHVMQKISEDDIFNKLAKSAKTMGEQEFIYQIINSMIKNTIPANQLKGTVENYIQGFNDYLGLVNKDAFTEQYIKSEVAKLETSSILRSMMPEAVTALKWNGINLIGTAEAEAEVLRILWAEVIKITKNLGLKRLFQNGSTWVIMDNIGETIKNIKNSDLSIADKHKALINQSLAYSNTYLVDTLLKNADNTPNLPTITRNGKKETVDPNILYRTLMIMRTPEFAASNLPMNAFLKNKYLKDSMPKWGLNVQKTAKAIEVDESNKVRLTSSIPVKHIPNGKNVIVTLDKKSSDVTYAGFEDTDGLYITMSKFLKEKADPTVNYLIPSKFMNQSLANPEVSDLVDIIKWKGVNIYPVDFTVSQIKGKKYVEQDGFAQLTELFSLQRTSVELPDFEFEHLDSVKWMSRLSENTANKAVHSEMESLVNGTYVESANAEKILTDMWVSPVKDPVVLEADLIHNLGEFGKLGEIVRTVLRSIIWQSKSKDIETALVQWTVITDTIKQEWLDSISGNADLKNIYIGGKTLEDISDEELANIDIEAIVENLDPEQAIIARARHAQMLKESRGESVKDVVAKYKKWEEAFNAIIDILVTDGKSYTEISEIVRTIIQKHKGWRKDVLNSKAATYIPSFDSYIINKLVAPVLGKYQVSTDVYKQMIEKEYDSVVKANFGQSNNFADNDHIIAMFIQTMQEQDILPGNLDVYAVLSNLLPEDRKHIHDVINNYYQEDIWKLIADENIAEYFKSTVKKLKDTFLGNKIEATSWDTFTADDLQKGVIELSDDEDGAVATRVLNEKDNDTNVYERIMWAFLPKLRSYNEFEKEMILPDTFTLSESKWKILFESDINLHTWASQPNHKVATATPAAVQWPKATAEESLLAALRLKAYNIFNKKSKQTINMFKSIDNINNFEKMEYNSPKELEDALVERKVSLEIGWVTKKVWDFSIGDKLLFTILNKLKSKVENATVWMTDSTIFTMITANGTKREYHIGNIMNSPIFRTLLEQHSDIISGNAILQILSLRKNVTKKILSPTIGDTHILSNIAEIAGEIETLYSKRIGGENKIGLSTDLLTKDGEDMVKAYLRRLTPGYSQIISIEWYSPIKINAKNGNTFDARIDKVTEKNTDLSTSKEGLFTGLNDYRAKDTEEYIEKARLTTLDQIDWDMQHIITEFVTHTGQNGKQYTVKQPIPSYDFTYVFRDLDKKSKTYKKTFQWTVIDWELTKIDEVEEIIEKTEVPRTIQPSDFDDAMLQTYAKSEICNL